jgi:hypothetical protein
MGWAHAAAAAEAQGKINITPCLAGPENRRRIEPEYPKRIQRRENPLEVERTGPSKKNNTSLKSTKDFLGRMFESRAH